MPVLITLLIFVAALFGYMFYAYNRLAQLRNAMETEWANVDVLLKKRADLIPNIVEVVKGYAKHEEDTLTNVAQSRAKLASRGKQRSEDENDLSSFLSSILALRESYPDLKANQSFLDLQDQLSRIEGEIATVRFNYNDLVKAYNDFILKFPGNVVAGMTGFALADLFEFKESRDVPVIELGGH
jgi:LemA protein